MISGEQRVENHANSMLRDGYLGYNNGILVIEMKLKKMWGAETVLS